MYLNQNKVILYSMEEVQDKALKPSFEQIKSLCLDLTQKTTGGKLAIDNNTIQSTKDLLDEFKNIKNIFNAQDKKYNLNDEKLKEIEGKSREETYTSYQLLKALLSSFIGLRKSQGAITKDNYEDICDSCAQINSDWGRFFVSTQERFKLNDDQVSELYKTVFTLEGKGNIESYFSNKQEEYIKFIPSGIMAFINTFLHLKKEFPGWKFIVPDIKVDKEGVDLILMPPENSKESPRFYEVKGNLGVKELKITDITNKKGFEEVSIALKNNKNLSPEVKTRSLANLYKLRSYSEREKGRGYRAEAPSCIQ